MEPEVEDLKESYPTYLKLGILIALLILIAGFLLAPTYTPHPYVPKVEKPVQLTELPPELKSIEEPPPIAKPELPVEAETEEEVEKTTIAKTEFTGFEKAPPPPDIVTPDFVPYDTPPEPVRLVKPNYPDIARKAGIEGFVILKLLVDVDGSVLDAKVLQSLNKVCDEEAVKAAKASLFRPAKQRDKPVRVWVAFPVQFTLRDK